MSSPVACSWADVIKGPLLERAAGCISLWGCAFLGVIRVLNSESTCAGGGWVREQAGLESKNYLTSLTPLSPTEPGSNQKRGMRGPIPSPAECLSFSDALAKLQENSKVLGEEKLAWIV